MNSSRKSVFNWTQNSNKNFRFNDMQDSQFKKRLNTRKISKEIKCLSRADLLELFDTRNQGVACKNI